MGSTAGTYLRIFAVRILMGFQRVRMNVGNDGVGIWNIVMGVRNDVIGVWRMVMNARTSGVSVRSVVMNISMCVPLKFPLEAKCQQ